MEIFGVSLPGLLSQLLLGLVNGSFYAILSLGLAVIFGLLNVINFAHGALFMTGALLTWMAMNYLKAVEAAKSVDADKVMTTWRGMKMNDFFGSGQLRADGRYVHDMYLMEVKKPAESTKPWDYYKLIKKLPGDSVFTTKAESKCPLWK